MAKFGRGRWSTDNEDRGFGGNSANSNGKGAQNARGNRDAEEAEFDFILSPPTDFVLTPPDEEEIEVIVLDELEAVGTMEGVTDLSDVPDQTVEADFITEPVEVTAEIFDVSQAIT